VTPALEAHEPLERAERFGLALGLMLAAALMWPLRHHVIDDTFVHLRYASHLAQGEGPVFNTGEHVYGCTSPLWIAFIADGMALGLNGLRVARVMGLLATLATIPLFLQLMRRSVRLPALRALATVAWSANAWLLMWSMSGMETPLAVALVIAGFVAFTEGKQWGTRPVRTGALWALAALARPEAVLLLLLWGITLLVDANNRVGLRRLVYGVVPPALVYGAWLLFARLFFGTFWPRALAARGAVHAGLDLPGLFGQLRVVAQTDGVPLLLLAASLAFGARAVRGRGPLAAQRALPWLWLLLTPLLYAARGVPPNSRYLLLVLPVLEWLAWRAADAWWLPRGAGPRPRRVPAAVLGFAATALAVLVNVGVYESQVVPQVERSTALLHGGLIPWGEWFKNHAPPGAAIAAPEVGAIGFLSGTRVLDLTGLISPELEPSPLRARDPVARLALARVARPEFLIDRAPRAFELLERSPYAAALAPLGRAPAGAERGRADSVYTFYRIDWSVLDTLAAARAAGGERGRGADTTSGATR